LSIGERIEHLANECGGIASLARSSGVSRTALQGFITRGNKPSRRTLFAIQEVTGCSWEWLVEGKGNAPQVSPERLRRSPTQGLGSNGNTTIRPRSSDQAELDRLEAITLRVISALAKANQSALDSALPLGSLALYRYGLSIPGPNHMSIIAKLADTTVAALVNGE
jgi:transcriptional regulator with XRE-family HTH domain